MDDSVRSPGHRRSASRAAQRVQCGMRPRILGARPCRVWIFDCLRHRSRLPRDVARQGCCGTPASDAGAMRLSDPAAGDVWPPIRGCRAVTRADSGVASECDGRRYVRYFVVDAQQVSGRACIQMGGSWCRKGQPVRRHSARRVDVSVPRRLRHRVCTGVDRVGAQWGRGLHIECTSKLGIE